MYEKFAEFLRGKKRLCIIQAENPDGDSLGSAIALDYILGTARSTERAASSTKEATEKDSTETLEIALYCPVDIPKYLRYFSDWSRVENEIDYKADGYIIVDTAANVLLSKLLDDAAMKNCLYTKPVFVLDHHATEDDLEFPHEAIIETLPACAMLIFKLARELGYEIPKAAAEAIYAAIASDTLGLVSNSVDAETMRVMAELIDLGANPAEIDENRREYMKKSPRILDYKADLIKRIDYSLDGELATVHIPFEDIQQYSDEYNPNVLILEEMRLVENVVVAVAIKTYPDGKITGKVRTSVPVADQIAGYFGGGGHPFAAGFRAYDLSYDEVVSDLVGMMPKLLEQAAIEQSDVTAEED